MFLGIHAIKQSCIRLIGILIVLLIASSLLSCSKEEPKEEVFDYLIRVDDVKVDKNEAMIYVYQVIEEFEQIGGEDVWDFEDFSGGKSAEEVAKDAVLENIVRIKVLVAKSEEMKIVLDRIEEQKVVTEAEQYLAQMPDNFAGGNDIDISVMKRVFTEYAIAHKVTRQVTDDYIPSDDLIEAKLRENKNYIKYSEADPVELLTQVHADQIFFSKTRKNQEGEYVPLTDEEIAIQYKKAEGILQTVRDGGDFGQLMEEAMQQDDESAVTSDGKELNSGNLRFSLGMIPDPFAEAIHEMEIGETSGIIETLRGYHIIRLTEITEPSEEDVAKFRAEFDIFKEELKTSAIDELKNEAFNRLYEKWKEVVRFSLNRDEWDKIRLIEQ